MIGSSFVLNSQKHDFKFSKLICSENLTLLFGNFIVEHETHTQKKWTPLDRYVVAFRDSQSVEYPRDTTCTTLKLPAFQCYFVFTATI